MSTVRPTPWRPVWLLLASSVFLLAFSYVPIIGIGVYYLLPTVLLLLCCCAVAGATTAIRGFSWRLYIAVGLSCFVLLTVAGLQLRSINDRLGAQGVYNNSKIERQITAQLREPILLESPTAIYYDTALFDTAGPWCRAPCIVIERIEPYRRIKWENPEEILESLGVKPVTGEPTRIAVLVTLTEHSNRSQILVRVTDNGVVTALLNAAVPSSDREARFVGVSWPVFVLENTAIVRMLAPDRRSLEHGFIAEFLNAAIKLPTTEPVPVHTLEVTEIASESPQPPIKLDRSDPAFVRTHYIEHDPRCDGIVNVEGRKGVSDYYATFVRSTARAPQHRYSFRSPMLCAGDAVYRRIPSASSGASAPPSAVVFARYELDGRYSAEYVVPLPDNLAGHPIHVEPASVLELNGKLRFRARSVRFEWATDETGALARTPEGYTTEFAIVDRIVNLEAPLPTPVLGKAAEPTLSAPLN